MRFRFGRKRADDRMSAMSVDIRTAAQRLPTASADDIQRDFLTVKDAWGAKEVVVVVGADALQRRIAKIVADNESDGFTESRVKVVTDECPARVQLDSLNVSRTTGWRPYRIVKREDGEFAMYGHSSMYRDLAVSPGASELTPWVRELIPRHMARVEHQLPELARRPGWQKLASEPALSFVASARDATARHFDDVQIVVSRFDESDPKRIRQLMPGGYLEWVDNVFHRTGVQLGQFDVAHWLVCEDAEQYIVHLAYLPADRGGSALVPSDLK
ncbi:hypothetical protein [Nocardia anaemiae]|uniref:hypothetical protein n=1 Tax=Nocardia anaemiae TaxID=263910 RepID=UPI0007A37089|nr:hypothetical protein [Nocardia anaemiae]